MTQCIVEDIGKALYDDKGHRGRGQRKTTQLNLEDTGSTTSLLLWTMLDNLVDGCGGKNNLIDGAGQKITKGNYLVDGGGFSKTTYSMVEDKGKLSI